MSSFEDSGNPPNKNLPKTARNVVDIALQTVTAVRNLVPLEAAKGPLSVLCSLLTLLQVQLNYSLSIFQCLTHSFPDALAERRRPEGYR